MANQTSKPAPELRIIPACNPQNPGESNTAYGQRCLCFLLETGVSITIDDEGLALADRVAITAAIAPELTEATRQTISGARTTIARLQEVRRILAREAVNDLRDNGKVLADDRPNLGPMAALPVAPIVPTAPAAGARPWMANPALGGPPKAPKAPKPVPTPAPTPAPLGQLSGRFAGTEF